MSYNDLDICIFMMDSSFHGGDSAKSSEAVCCKQTKPDALIQTVVA